jgi:hypothetical protein
VKAAGSNAGPLPRGGTLARMTGVLFQGRGYPAIARKASFAKVAGGVLDLGDRGQGEGG